jgi:hypothetical protein
MKGDDREMTFEEAQAFVATFEIGDCFPFMMQTLKAELTCDPKQLFLYPVLELAVHGMAFDRDCAVDASGQRLVTRIDFRMKYCAVRLTRDFFLHILRHFMHEMVRHEMDEWIKVEGKRIFDPHDVDETKRLGGPLFPAELVKP